MTMMLNAPENGANPFGCSDYLNERESVLSCGLTVVEWMGGRSLHNKKVLIDDSLCIVGSMNFDMRSVYLDTELMLVIDCPELNRQLRAGFADMAEYSRTVSPQRQRRLRRTAHRLPALRRENRPLSDSPGGFSPLPLSAVTGPRALMTSGEE